MSKSKRPSQIQGRQLPFVDSRDTNEFRPKFCLQHLLPKYDVLGLKDKKLKAALIDQMQSLTQLSWKQIQLAPRHGLGQELIPVSSLKIQLPEQFIETERVVVLRYSGKLPMIGVRVEEVFHIIAIGRDFNDLYDHG